MIKSKLNLIKSAASIFFILQIIFGAAILSYPLPALAQSKKDSVKSLQFTPQITIPDSDFQSNVPTSVGEYSGTDKSIDSTLLPKYIGAIYKYGLAIAGILATIMLMAAGVIWLISGGDSGKVSQAKELISGSIAGLIILVVSWVILNTINPDLVNLKSIETTNLAKIEEDNLVCCWPNAGEIKYPVRIVDGKAIAVSGEYEGKVIKCDDNQCADDEVCRLNTNEKYSCFKDKICCNCRTNKNNLACKDGISHDECDKFCDTQLGKNVIGYKPNYYMDYYNDDNYDCISNQCVPVNQGKEINESTSPQTCEEATDYSACMRLGFCYWQDNKCITKSSTNAILCSENKNDIQESSPQCCCEQTNYKYTNCKWSVTGGNTYCQTSCGNTYTQVPTSYCQ